MAKKSFMESIKVESSLVRDIDEATESKIREKEATKPYGIAARPSMMTELRIFAAENNIRGASSVFTAMAEKFMDENGKLKKEELKKFLEI